MIFQIDGITMNYSGTMRPKRVALSDRNTHSTRITFYALIINTPNNLIQS